ESSLVIRYIKGKESPATGAGYLAAQRSMLLRSIVNAVKLGVRHLGRNLLFVLPMLVKLLPHNVDITALHSLKNLVADVFDVMHTINDAGLFFFGALLLLAQNLVRATGRAREKNQHVLVQFVGYFVGDIRLADLDRSVLGNLQDRQAAKSGHIRILLANRPLQNVSFDLKIHFCQLRQRHVLALHDVNGMQQADRIATGRTEPSASWNVGHRADFYILLNPGNA